MPHTSQLVTNQPKPTNKTEAKKKRMAVKVKFEYKSNNFFAFLFKIVVEKINGKSTLHERLNS
ncbi:MAG: hypothetical protein EAZ70_05200 [Runella slithyformis]|nr:MAG: hypothetical protein EAZ70_05200 [Runella slithyformis]TAF82074.1 MAG: hypothetical protein EAZ50_04880 [Runella slithyformis]